MAIPRTIIIIPYFGKWPAWIDLFLLSCGYNPTVNWLLVSDCGSLSNLPPNVRLVEIEWPEYVRRISQRTGVDLGTPAPYKICDFKPALGVVHEDDLDEYEYWGYGDLDVIYGNIRSFINEQTPKYNVISSHSWHVSGHFMLFRNEPWLLRAFRKIPYWDLFMQDPASQSLDEYHFSKLLMPNPKRESNRYTRNNLFVERHSTDVRPNVWVDGSSEFPKEWYWRDFPGVESAAVELLTVIPGAAQHEVVRYRPGIV